MTIQIDAIAREFQDFSSVRRLAVMDGLRGVAAMAVVALHSFADSVVVNGQLAVDQFFILSGFVIAYSYDAKLERIGTGQFLLRRFIRLYPMLFIGAVGGAVLAIIHNFTNPADRYEWSSLLQSGGLSLFVLPYLSPDISDKAFSFNPPIWSLFFEIIANVLYVVLARFLSPRVLIAIVLIGLAGVVWGGPLGGGDKAHFAAGLPRVIAGFFGGVLLFKLMMLKRLPAYRSNLVVLSTVILALFLYPTLIGGIMYLPAYLMLWCVVMLSANSHPSPLDKTSEFLGSVSYPIYLIHWLSLYIFTYIGKKIGLFGDLYQVVAYIHLIAIIPIGAILFHYYETPARRHLNQLLNPKKPLA